MGDVGVGSKEHGKSRVMTTHDTLGRLSNRPRTTYEARFVQIV